MRATLNPKDLLICIVFMSFLLPARPCWAQSAKETDAASHSDALPELPSFQASLPFILPIDTVASALIKSPLPYGTLMEVENLLVADRDHNAPDTSAAPAQGGFPYGPTRRQLTETIDPDKDRWELCSRVLARRDIVDRLSVPW